jgi:hypothetical protein
VTRFSTEAIFGLNSEEASSSPKDDGLDDVNEAILLTLSDEPFSSVRQMADSPQDMHSKTALYRWLVDSLHFIVRHLHWIHHKLSDSEKASQVKSNRVELLIQLRNLQLSIRHQECGFILTLDESWFYLPTDHEMTWLPDGDEGPDREKHMIQSPKLMPMCVWNPQGFQVIDSIPCQKERCSRPPTISEIFTPRSLLSVEWRET